MQPSQAEQGLDAHYDDVTTEHHFWPEIKQRPAVSYCIQVLLLFL